MKILRVIGDTVIHKIDQTYYTVHNNICNWFEWWN